MTEATRETLMRSIEDFEATLAKFQSNNVVLATPVGGELPVRRQLVFGTDRGNAAARRDDQARQEQVRMRRHVARASRHRASGARDAYCNNRRTHPAFALGRSRRTRVRIGPYSNCERGLGWMTLSDT